MMGGGRRGEIKRPRKRQGQVGRVAIIKVVIIEALKSKG